MTAGCAEARAGAGGLAADGHRCQAVGRGGWAEGCSCYPEDGGAGLAEAKWMAVVKRLLADTAAKRLAEVESL